MSRTLPWLSKNSTTTTTLSRLRKADDFPRPIKRRKVQPPSLNPAESEEEDYGVSEPQDVLANRRAALRTPSTSPPPEPPIQELMIPDGTDDVWVMVEDEFLSTAQAFTQHLHHAEYVRLKQLAKTKSPATLRAIERPVDGQTAMRTELLQKKKLNSKHDMIEAALKTGSERDNDESEDDRIRDRNLAGLMGSPRLKRGKRADLTGLLGKVESRTRASKGFERSSGGIGVNGGGKMYDIPGAAKFLEPESRREVVPLADEEEEAEDDDLDAPLHRSVSHFSKTSTSASRNNPSPPSSPPLTPKRLNLGHETSLFEGHSAVRKDASRLDTEADIRSPSISAVDSLQKRSALPSSHARWQRRANADVRNERNKIKIEEVPTFLV